MDVQPFWVSQGYNIQATGPLLKSGVICVGREALLVAFPFDITAGDTRPTKR